jgi:hypothetical protein
VLKDQQAVKSPDRLQERRELGDPKGDVGLLVQSRRLWTISSWKLFGTGFLLIGAQFVFKFSGTLNIIVAALTILLFLGGAILARWETWKNSR